MKRRVESTGDGADQADVLGSTAYGRQCGQRLEKPARAIGKILGRMAVGKEYGVQLAPLCDLRQRFKVADVAHALHGRCRMTPGRPMVAAAEYEQVDMHHGAVLNS